MVAYPISIFHESKKEIKMNEAILTYLFLCIALIIFVPLMAANITLTVRWNKRLETENEKLKNMDELISKIRKGIG